MDQRRFVVVGASNVDISATSSAPLVQGDSNPGHIHTGLGGVGRNIAENLARLVQNVSLLSAFGEDAFAERALANAAQIGLDCTLSLRIPGGASSVYVCINGPDGDMAVAVNDMALCARITPEVILQRLDAINSADAVVVDANLNEETITVIANRCSPPLFADAVSTPKAARLLPVLPRFFGLKANRLEMETLTGMSISGESDLAVAAGKLHTLGVRYVLVTLGEHGAFASDGSRHAFACPHPTPILNATGCGDAFTAAAMMAILQERSLETILDYGLTAANICSQSEEAVSPQLTNTALNQWMRNTKH
ncbi:MAG: carbohydrate kinase family protein [Eubacteriales bacterium]|nr:carbohydrate kinase family protein [Eubacteriales bacterium]